MNIGEYLQANFPGGVKEYKEITSNGALKGYYVRGNNGDEMYLPTSTTGNVGMLSYIPGSGGSGTDAARIREQIEQNPPSYPITIAASCSDHNNCIEVGYSLAQGANMNVTNNVTVCFSASGFLGISRTEDFEDNHPDVSSTVISCEPYNTGYFKYSDETKTDGFRNSNSQILFVAPKSGFHVNLESEIKNMTGYGLNAYFLETAYSGSSGNVHIRTNADILTNGIIDYLLGYSSDFNTNPGNGEYSPNYRLVKFNPTTSTYEEMTYDELASTVKVIRIPNIEKLTAIDSFNIETVVSPVQEKYKTLKTLGRKDVKGTVMKTNYVFASNKMNDLRSLVEQTSFISSLSNQTFRSSDGIPGCITAAINAYYDIVGSLLSSLSLETDSILSYTQAVVDMDQDLANSVPTGQIVADSEQKQKIPIGLEQKEEKPVNNNSSGGGYIPTPTPIQQEEEEVEKEPDYRYDFDGYQGLIYLENGKVSEIKFRYTYDTEEQAKKELEQIKELYKEKDYIEEVIQKKTYVDVIFKEESYKEKTLEEIIKEYFEGGKYHG